MKDVFSLLRKKNFTDADRLFIIQNRHKINKFKENVFQYYCRQKNIDLSLVLRLYTRESLYYSNYLGYNVFISNLLSNYPNEKLLFLLLDICENTHLLLKDIQYHIVHNYTKSYDLIKNIVLKLYHDGYIQEISNSDKLLTFTNVSIETFQIMENIFIYKPSYYNEETYTYNFIIAFINNQISIDLLVYVCEKYSLLNTKQPNETNQILDRIVLIKNKHLIDYLNQKGYSL